MDNTWSVLFICSTKLLGIFKLLVVGFGGLFLLFFFHVFCLLNLVCARHSEYYGEQDLVLACSRELAG